MDKDLQNAIFRVMVAFTDYNTDDYDVFIPGLTIEQYAALRDLNVIRIDSGDDRVSEDYVLDGDGKVVGNPNAS